MTRLKRRRGRTFYRVYVGDTLQTTTRTANGAVRAARRQVLAGVPDVCVQKNSPAGVWIVWSSEELN